MFDPLWRLLGSRDRTAPDALDDKSSDSASATLGLPTYEPLPSDLVQLAAGQGGFAYNLKVIIRGASKTGKTSLFHRLQGQQLPAAYTPTLSIKTATIRWAERAKSKYGRGPSSGGAGGGAPDVEVTKIEVWDVVDAGAAMPPGRSSEPDRRQQVPLLPSMPLDATTVNVYNGCNCVIFMIDVTRRDTLSYVERQLPSVPLSCIVVFCVNFMDCVADPTSPCYEGRSLATPEASLASVVANATGAGSSLRPRAVTDADLQRLCDGRLGAWTPFMGSVTDGRPSPAFQCPPTVVHCSMRTSVGLRVLHRLLSCPVTLVQIDALETQLHGFYTKLGVARAEALQIDADIGSVRRTTASIASSSSEDDQGQPASLDVVGEAPVAGNSVGSYRREYQSLDEERAAKRAADALHDDAMVSDRTRLDAFFADDHDIAPTTIDGDVS